MSNRAAVVWLCVLAFAAGAALFLPKALSGAVLTLVLWNLIALVIVAKEQAK